MIFTTHSTLIGNDYDKDGNLWTLEHIFCMLWRKSGDAPNFIKKSPSAWWTFLSAPVLGIYFVAFSIIKSVVEIGIILPPIWTWMVSLKMAFTIPFNEMVELTEIFFDSDWFATRSTPFEIGKSKGARIKNKATLIYSEKYSNILLWLRIFLKKSVMFRSG